MACSIVNSLSIIEPIWKPYIKTDNFNPFKIYIQKYNKLSTAVELLGELYPAYGLGWITVELEIEKYFQSKLDKWEQRKFINNTVKFESVVSELKLTRIYLFNTYKELNLSNNKVKQIIRTRVMQNVENISFLDHLVNTKITT